MAVFPSKVNYATGDILTATNMNEVGQAINLLDGAQFAAGKNKIINGDFGIWQRGTSFTPAAANTIVYNTDRFFSQRDGTGATVAVSQQTFTPGTAPVAGYEGQFFYRYAQTVAGTGGTYNTVLSQSIEDVRTFAGQTVTLSFWAKSSTSSTITMGVNQFFGSGGSGSVNASAGADQLLTTSWARYTRTFAVPAITGKTVGTSSYLQLYFGQPTANTVGTYDFWGVQLEAASTASPFQTATGTKQGELAACQRYYYRDSNIAIYDILSNVGSAYSTTGLFFNFPLKVTMRTKPTAVEYASIYASAEDAGSTVSLSSFVIYHATPNNAVVSFGTTGATQFRPYWLMATSATVGASYVGFSAEL